MTLQLRKFKVFTLNILQITIYIIKKTKKMLNPKGCAIRPPEGVASKSYRKAQALCMYERKTMHVCHWRFASLMTDLADVAGCATFHTLAVYEMGLETLYDKIFVI